MHNAVKLKEIGTQQDYEAMNFTARKTLDLHLKLWNIKKDKVMDIMCHLYPYLWNQCTLPLKSKIKSHPKHAAAKRNKDTVLLWLLIEEVCTSTLSINSVA